MEIHIIFAVLWMTSMINTVEGKCRRIKYTKVADDKELVNHTIAVFGWTVNDLSLCMAKCFQETQGCVSFNFCSTPNGWKECRLLNSSHLKNESFLAERKGCEYYTSESTCSSSPCVKNATCVPHMPWDRDPYSCLCPAGFTGQACQIDIDECASSGACHVNATCINIPGKYNCMCKLGFQGDRKQCNDIDECATGAHTCHAQGTCHNTVGSYSCHCKPGYTGDGKSCFEIDECATGVHTCSVQATCQNTVGSYNCTCKLGFQGDGKQCNDIDECTTRAHTCSGQATCSNTLGSYSCQCKPGYIGDGKLCSREFACSGYIKFNDPTRSMNYSETSMERCDNGIHESKWYRFISPAGVRMPTSCTQPNRCSASGTGWLKGEHPKVEQGLFDMTVCFSLNQNCCYVEKKIRVCNCYGKFYTYQLKNLDPPPCLRYCGTN